MVIYPDELSDALVFGLVSIPFFEPLEIVCLVSIWIYTSYILVNDENPYEVN